MNGSLVDQLIKEGYLKSPLIIEAFRKIKRADFVPGEMVKDRGRDFVAEYNAPLSIGYGQTISQPLTVAFMLELLQPKKGDKVLDIGSGSGWQTAMLCQIVGSEGFVYGIERIPELKEFGQTNVQKYNFENVEFICGDGSLGLRNEAPFDKIIVAASVAEEIPQPWKDQLKIKGRLVTPVRGSIWLVIKKEKTRFEEKEYPGFVFVPLISEQ
ncbi:MAG: protein-L-isoaspartate O-methyltransferase [Candidatus Portnoybacteria bacterium]|nr:protein-L-isoaspartate O-methyltransferase [Candidatus Portnoybacteria bacterium]